MLGCNIVVLDDSELWRELSRHVLQSAGYSVRVLTSPFQLSSALAEAQPDLVLIDVSMPALTGDKLVEMVRRHGLTRSRLVLHSDRSTSELVRLVAASGADAFIQKSRGAQNLVGEVERLLRPSQTVL